DAELHFRLAEHRILRSDSKRTRHRELTSTTQGVAVNRSDDGFTELLDVVEYGLAGKTIVAAAYRHLRGKFVDVGSRDKRLVAAAGQYHDANFFVAFRRFKRSFQFANRFSIQRVSHRGSIDGDVSNTVLLLVEQVFKHGYRPLEQRFRV